MSLDKEGLSNLRCKYCGERIYRSYSGYTINVWRKPPSNCPKCGVVLSIAEKEYLVKREDTIYSLICILSCFLFIIFFIVSILIINIFI